MAGDAVTDVLDMPPDERAAAGYTDEDVRDALISVLTNGRSDATVVEGATLPDIDLSYFALVGASGHPLVFRDCTIGTVSFTQANWSVPIHFENCTVEGLELSQARFEYDVTATGTTFTGPVTAEEPQFDRDGDFSRSTFEEGLRLIEADFGDDATFTDVVVEGDCDLSGSTFHGVSNELNDNASFVDMTITGDAYFRQVNFEAVTFDGISVAGEAVFEKTRFEHEATFVGATVEGEADFDRADFEDDADFSEVTFAGSANFRGAFFEGGAQTPVDDARFDDATFRDDALFGNAHSRSFNFSGATVAGFAEFEEMWFDGDADFSHVRFRDEVDFDEVRFREDADFRATRFDGPARFRGAEFQGETNTLEENAMFKDVNFGSDVDFDSAVFTSATFDGVTIEGDVRFAHAHIEDMVMAIDAVPEGVRVDFTGAVVKEGTISQPADRSVPYDLTLASVGDVKLTREGSTKGRLLDQFRFCETEFSEFDGYEFDFAAHDEWLDRNDWLLHHFDHDGDYALEMTPAVVENTYLNAKQAAAATGYIKAAGEFRVRRQQYARRKHVAIARDPEVQTSTRLRNASRALENWFLGATCGYGVRLNRILWVFVLVPLLPAMLYAFGGKPFETGAGQLSSLGAVFTADGLGILYQNIYFSYITYLTIGYGGIGPKGAAARMLAGIEVYGSVVFGALLVYALIKRSEF
jgi:uncharacterized protein YjbI with pentapeptide repeats